MLFAHHSAADGVDDPYDLEQLNCRLNYLVLVHMAQIPLLYRFDDDDRKHYKRLDTERDQKEEEQRLVFVELLDVRFNKNLREV